MRSMRITHKTSSNAWALRDAETGAELGVIYREVGDTDANFGQVCYKAFPARCPEAHFATLGQAQRHIDRVEMQFDIDARRNAARN